MNKQVSILFFIVLFLLLNTLYLGLLLGEHFVWAFLTETYLEFSFTFLFTEIVLLAGMTYQLQTVNDLANLGEVIEAVDESEESSLSSDLEDTWDEDIYLPDYEGMEVTVLSGNANNLGETGTKCEIIDVKSNGDCTIAHGTSWEIGNINQIQLINENRGILHTVKQIKEI